MGALEDKLEALLRGGAQAATAGWGDEGVAALLGALPKPNDPEGFSRIYSAGSAEQDYRNTERAANEEAQRKYPSTFGSGAMLGGAPLMTIGTELGGVPGAGLMGGARGAVSGAGHSTEGDRIQGGARLAAPSALASMAGAAAPTVLGKLADSLKGGGPPTTGGLSPVYASAGASMGQEAAQEGLPLINMMSTMPAKGAKGVRLSPDDRIVAEDAADWARRNPEAAAQKPNIGRPAIPPRAPETPEEAYTPTIPPQTKPWAMGLNDAYKEIGKADDAYANQAKEVAEQLEVRKILRDEGVMPPLRNSNDPMHNVISKDAWRELYKNPEIKIPKAPKVPNLEKENQIAEDHARLLEGIDKIKNKGKGTIEQTTMKPGGLEKQTLRVAPNEVSAKDEDIKTLMGTMPL